MTYVQRIFNKKNGLLTRTGYIETSFTCTFTLVARLKLIQLEK